MFRHDKGQIDIPDIEIGAFKTMLTFIYSKHFNGLDANNWLDVLKAADKYNITGLVKECVNFPIEKLPNVFVAFEQALLLNMEDKFSTENIGKILRDELRSSEIELWNAALHWSDEQCRQKGIECSAENRREILGPALFKIRFPLIPKEEFTKSVVLTGVLTTEEVISIYQHYSHPNLSGVPGLFPLKFPTQQRYKYEGTIEMEIGKVSKFAVKLMDSYRFSDAMEIGGFSWKIKAIMNRKNKSNEKWLGFYLSYNGPTKELLDPSKGFYNKKEDNVKLAIDVIVEEPKTEKIISDPNKSNGTISMEIENLSEFAREITESERKSETVYIKGMPWKILAQIEKKNESTDEKWLGFFLLSDDSERDGNWSRKCSATLRIVSQKSGVEDFKEEFNEKVFNKKAMTWGWSNFISFAELMKPNKGLYNKDEDKVQLAIDFACE
ncbi:hypothetical protein niasHS_004473 [Heterodera schachtii]|uniref:MATH domain-containing protein n=1 Tax=Heterodera schachtii TaxID=97005 RepID=A0ABD2JJ79_HETSC